MGIKNFFIKTANRRFFTGVAFVVLGLAWLALWWPSNHGSNEVEPVENHKTIVDESVVMDKALPTRLRIPKVNIDATFERPLGLNEDKTVEVPDSYTEVGWYKYGPTPGERGPAVILGHVDSYQGPAVFWSLGQLDVGDEILVDREDGTTAQFEVTKLERVAQSEFPTISVYGDIDHAGLRLITCTGIYDHGVERYSHNLIVFAKLKETVEE
ncbi:class F sortase [Candidatus Kaiserbacteria bacterium]|nr:class F sortase [Candidatus Kaiserbacteria bacterium]